jgi:hypothetical protein
MSLAQGRPRSRMRTGILLGSSGLRAPSFGVELAPVGYNDADEIERGIVAFARGPNSATEARGPCSDR